MIKKEDLPFDKTHVPIPLEKAIGRTVLCEDGVEREVKTIVHCAGSFNLCIINEDLQNEISGHTVHLLKLFHLLRDQPPPTEEEIKKFDEIALSWDFQYGGHKPSPKKLTKFVRTMDQKTKSKPFFFSKGRKH